MEDIIVEVGGVHCRLILISPQAKHWGKVNFSRDDLIVVDIWHCANHIRAIEAEGMRVTPGAWAKVGHAKRRLLPAIGSERSDRPLRRRRTGMSGGPMPRQHVLGHTQGNESPIGVEMTIIKFFSATLISVVLSVRLWHILEPLLSDLRQWWSA